jgi:hypothetical protein
MPAEKAGHAEIGTGTAHEWLINTEWISGAEKT